MDTTAIIHFIGIVLFSAQIPDDPGVHAIIPRIGSTTTAVSFISNVEEHTAAIIYRQEDLLEKSTAWKTITAPNRDWEYVVLDGERVQFVTDDGNSDPVSPPPLLPRIGQGSCLSLSVAPTLTADFLPATSYRGAAGVFDIPNGRIEACDGGGARSDTRVLMQTRNMLIITAKKAGQRAKSITLDEDAVVFVVNVPPDFLTANPHPHHNPGAPHFSAYNAMLGGTCSARPEPFAPVLPGCDSPDALTSEAYKKARKNPPSRNLGLIMDPQCGNTQWP